MSSLLVRVFTVLTTVTFYQIDNAPISRWEKNLMCSEIPMLVLESILGGAFNSRYMSIDKPIEGPKSPGSGKRGVPSAEEDFYVDNTFLEEVDSEPAWEVKNHVQATKKKYGLNRSKRELVQQNRTRRGYDYLQQWHCGSKVEWMDLGPDYFPRYLRSVVCLTQKCWFDLYQCRPRSFTVKLLRRKKGFCANKTDNYNKVGLLGLPEELKELWVWEERAVNFCCDCARN